MLSSAQSLPCPLPCRRCCGAAAAAAPITSVLGVGSNWGLQNGELDEFNVDNFFRVQLVVFMRL